MISKDMYRLLKTIPHYPESITLSELQKLTKIAPCTISVLLDNGISTGLIRYASRNPYNSVATHPVSLTEDGQIEIEEYRRTSNSSTKATWAIIISAISAVIALVGCFFPLT